MTVLTGAEENHAVRTGAARDGHERRFAGNGCILPVGRTSGRITIRETIVPAIRTKWKKNCQILKMDVMGFRAAYSGNG